MRKLRRFFFIIIFLYLLVCNAAIFLPKAYAASTMTASESCVEFIKGIEVFSPRPYYDYRQHTVGYGTKCPTEKYFAYLANGISREEAEALLREAVADVEEAINKMLIAPYNLTFTQHQFDALVSFSFNLGTGWMTYDSTLKNAILTNANESDMVYALSLYCTAGGNYSSGLVSRRLCEANMFLNGIYSQSPSDAYGYVFYEPNGGSLTYRVQGFICEKNSAPVADALRNGDVFLGWYSDLTGGSQVTELNQNLTGKTLFARWQSSVNSEHQDFHSAVINVTGDVVNIRKGPGTNYGISTQVYKNDSLILSQVTHLLNTSWGKVQDGWICLDYTDYDVLLNGTSHTNTEGSEHTSDKVTVPNNNPAFNDIKAPIDASPSIHDVVFGIVNVKDLLRIRSGPGTSYSTVGYLSKGQKIEILEKKTVGSMVWGRITSGWVSMDYITTNFDSILETDAAHNQETAPEQEVMKPVGKVEATAIEGKITADALRIRSYPGTSNSIVGFYYQNDMVSISEKMLLDSVYWGKTDKGWINMDYVLTGSSNEDTYPSSETGVRTVIADCLRIRKEIGTHSRIADLLYLGDTVTVLETKTVDGMVWGRVDKGWICMDYVN